MKMLHLNDIAEAASDLLSALPGPCSDLNCIIQRRRGAGTNGGCKCLQDRPRDVRTALRAYRDFAENMLGVEP